MKKTKLSIKEREKIFYYLTLNKSYQDIGLLLARSYTTISREIKKNTIEGGYSPSRAEDQVRSRRCKCGRKNKIDTNNDLFEEVFQRIFKKWSPEQISGYINIFMPKLKES